MCLCPQAPGVSTENHVSPRSDPGDDGGSVVSRPQSFERSQKSVGVVKDVSALLQQPDLHGACRLLPLPTEMVL